MTQFKGNRSKQDILSGVTSNVTWSRKRYNNTVEYALEDGTRAIRLHDTDIITWMPNGDIILNSGGWQTRTTKDRINKLQFYPIFQHQNIWYITVNNETHVFQDNMIITSKGKVKGAGSKKVTQKYQKQIKEYVKAYCEKLFNCELESPSGGDCWFCALKDIEGKPMGEAFRNSDHIIQHMKEKYYVPSLVINACNRFQISQAGWHTLRYYFNQEEDQYMMFADVGQRQIKSSLTRYLRSQLGMAD